MIEATIIALTDGLRWWGFLAALAGVPMAGQQFSYSGAGSTTHIGIGGIAVIQFDTLQEALDCVNSGLFPA